MSNKVVSGLEKAFGWLEGAVKWVIGISEKVHVILKREKALQPSFVTGLVSVVKAAEVLIVEAEAAASDKGLNFEKDSKAYDALKTLIEDFKKFEPVVKAAIEALK